MKNIIRTWASEYPADQLILAIHGDQSSAKTENIGAATLRLRLRPHGVAIAFELPIRALQVGADVTVTHNFSPLFGGPRVAMIQDVLFIDHPEWFTRAERIYFWGFLPSGRRASAIVGTSKTETARIQKHLGPRLTVQPIGLAIAHELQSALPVEPSHVLPSEFFLVVGRMNTRKNLERLLMAALTTDTVSATCPLVVAGEDHGSFESLVSEFGAKLAEKTIFLGKVTDGELAWLYGRCRLFLFPTLGEGYGLPPLEALHFGALIATSDLPVLRELLPRETYFFDPSDVGSIRGAFAAVSRSSPITEYVHDSTWADVVGRLRRVCENVAR